MTLPVSLSDLGTYLNDTIDPTRGQFILNLAHTLCESVVNPLPVGAEVVVLDVTVRAYANPTDVAGQDPGLYSEGVGPLSTSTPGYSSGGLYLTQENKATLRRLAGTGGAFSIDTTPSTAGQSLPWWDTGATFSTGDWDSPV